MDQAMLFAISAAGMSVERTRIEVATLNLANATTVQSTEGGSYQPLRVVARAALPEGASFHERVDEGLSQLEPSAVPLPQASVEPTGAPPRQVHDPDNPFANPRGDVAYPGVDTATEMVTLMSALRAYEANVAAMNVSRTMLVKTLEIGGGT